MKHEEDSGYSEYFTPTELARPYDEGAVDMVNELGLPRGLDYAFAFFTDDEGIGQLARADGAQCYDENIAHPERWHRKVAKSFKRFIGAKAVRDSDSGLVLVWHSRYATSLSFAAEDSEEVIDVRSIAVFTDVYRDKESRSEYASSTAEHGDVYELGKLALYIDGLGMEPMGCPERVSLTPFKHKSDKGRAIYIAGGVA